MLPNGRKFVHPGTVKQGYLTKSPPLEKKKGIIAPVSYMHVHE